MRTAQARLSRRWCDFRMMTLRRYGDPHPPALIMINDMNAPSSEDGGSPSTIPPERSRVSSTDRVTRMPSESIAPTTASIMLSDPRGRLVALFGIQHDAAAIAARFLELERAVLAAG